MWKFKVFLLYFNKSRVILDLLKMSVLDVLVKISKIILWVLAGIIVLPAVFIANFYWDKWVDFFEGL